MAGRAEGADDTDAASRAEDVDWAAQVGQRSQMTQTPQIGRRRCRTREVGDTDAVSGAEDMEGGLTR